MIRYLRMFCALALLIAAPAPSLAQMTFSSPGFAATSGTYTPTFTLTSNVTAAALNASTLAFYTRQGNVVTVSMAVSITPTATSTSTTLGISLPVASDLIVLGDLAGRGSADTATFFGGPVVAGTGSDVANYKFNPGAVVTAVNHYITFSYRVQ